MADPGTIRASDAERDATIERLRTAAGEGRLTLEELTDRIGEAAGATVTRGELERLTADLPAEAAGGLVAGGGVLPGAGGGAALSGGPGGGAVPGAAGGAVQAAPIAAHSVFGDHRRNGVWRLPQTSSWKTAFGDIKLDLREAHVPAGTIEIEARTIFGDVELLVPEGVLVEARMRPFFGETKQSAGSEATAGAPHIVLTGSTLFGDVRIQARRLRERFAERFLGRPA
jgi:hypothetical protein